jgi:hypothetical protein
MMMPRCQYWIMLACSLLVALTTWFDTTVDQRGALNAALVCCILVVIASLELNLPGRMNLAQSAVGLWLTCSPLLLGYAGAGEIAYSHFAIGLLLALFGMFQFIYDWKAVTKKRG